MASIPVPYIGTGNQQQVVLGHYAVGQKSGASVSLGAGATIGRIRWAPTASALFLVLMRIRLGWTVTGAVTAATPMDADAVVARNFTADFTSGAGATQMTMINMNGVTNMMRRSMSPSQMGANGPGICNTGIAAGQTLTADAAAFAITSFPNQPSGNATVTQAIGVGATPQTLYEWTGLGQHPVTLSNNEGVVVRTVTAPVVSGTVAYYLTWEWAEVLVF